MPGREREIVVVADLLDDQHMRWTWTWSRGAEGVDEVEIVSRYYYGRGGSVFG